MTEPAGGEIPCLRVLRQEAHSDGILAGGRQVDVVLLRPIAQQSVRGLDQAARAVIDRLLGLRAGEIDIGFRVDVHEFDLVAEIREHFRRGKRAAIAALSGLREKAGAR